MFWQINLGAGDSTLFNLLDKEDLTLNEIIKEDDLIQECKAQCTKLVNFLHKPENLHQLVDLLLTSPLKYISQEQDTISGNNSALNKEEEFLYEQSKISCEILTSDNSSIYMGLINDTNLLDKILNYYDFENHNMYNENEYNTLPDQKIAQSVTRLLTHIVSRSPERMLAYFISKKPDFINNLNKHLNLSSHNELITHLASKLETEKNLVQYSKWFVSQNYVEDLFSYLDPYMYDELTHDSVYMIFSEIFKYSTTYEYLQPGNFPEENMPLVNDMLSSKSISTLLNYTFPAHSDQCLKPYIDIKGSIMSALRILLLLVEYLVDHHSPSYNQKETSAGTYNVSNENDQSFICDPTGTDDSFTAQNFNDSKDESLDSITENLESFNHIDSTPYSKQPLPTDSVDNSLNITKENHSLDVDPTKNRVNLGDPLIVETIPKFYSYLLNNIPPSYTQNSDPFLSLNSYNSPSSPIQNLVSSFHSKNLNNPNVPGVGQIRFLLLQIIGVYTYSNDVTLLNRVLETNIMGLIMELFFQFPDNSLIHNQTTELVKTLYQNISRPPNKVSPPDINILNNNFTSPNPTKLPVNAPNGKHGDGNNSTSRTSDKFYREVYGGSTYNPNYLILKQLLTENDLLTSIMNAWESNEYDEDTKQLPRRGYMGHLLELSNLIQQQNQSFSQQDNLFQYIDERILDRWDEFQGSLAKINDMNSLQMSVKQLICHNSFAYESYYKENSQEDEFFKGAALDDGYQYDKDAEEKFESNFYNFNHEIRDIKYEEDMIDTEFKYHDEDQDLGEIDEAAFSRMCRERQFHRFNERQEIEADHDNNFDDPRIETLFYDEPVGLELSNNLTKNIAANDFLTVKKQKTTQRNYSDSITTLNSLSSLRNIENADVVHYVKDIKTYAHNYASPTIVLNDHNKTTSYEDLSFIIREDAMVEPGPSHYLMTDLQHSKDVDHAPTTSTPNDEPNNYIDEFSDDDNNVGDIDSDYEWNSPDLKSLTDDDFDSNKNEIDSKNNNPLLSAKESSPFRNYKPSIFLPIIPGSDEFLNINKDTNLQRSSTPELNDNTIHNNETVNQKPEIGIPNALENLKLQSELNEKLVEKPSPYKVLKTSSKNQNDPWAAVIIMPPDSFHNNFDFKETNHHSAKFPPKNIGKMKPLTSPCDNESWDDNFGGETQ
ncbi:uncharacterized protein LOC135925484 isoform X2 [Gordionus sp. m RMFG-2023]|uniref:uncharacterized protein LOC135925484 isoform X2 n=1 Tax=Gordionus sp. m RMFG-2023 TaxID=3053472 RepID=UPI0031FCD4CA